MRCSAITLGRIAWVCPETIAPHLEHFVGVWCAALRTIRDDVEKEHAFLGLISMLRLNPQAGPSPLRQSARREQIKATSQKKRVSSCREPFGPFPSCAKR